MFKELNIDQLMSTIPFVSRYKFIINRKKDRKKAQRKIHQIIDTYQISNTHCEFDRAIGNAMSHGHCPVKCYVYVTRDHRMLCIVKDSGYGFDYQETILKFRNKEIYYHHHGLGMRCYASNPHLEVDWNNHGTIIILYYH